MRAECIIGVFLWLDDILMEFRGQGTTFLFHQVTHHWESTYNVGIKFSLLSLISFLSSLRSLLFFCFIFKAMIESSKWSIYKQINLSPTDTDQLPLHNWFVWNVSVPLFYYIKDPLLIKVKGRRKVRGGGERKFHHVTHCPPSKPDLFKKNNEEKFNSLLCKWGDAVLDNKCVFHNNHRINLDHTCIQLLWLSLYHVTWKLKSM